ncbi:hypothetical protein KSC_023020 [Ktedonobacter sp. SOSP1-52]|uniref:PAS domain-containing protein n=1 Tax=Ktedonobacter sp. SOSP1-52 TaxID=2778366 RepID=UPI001914E7E0|nr:PAS domain S-box protein [Ktedonobacter sp. SOSP1-52]GHO63410.1 hypothetical protein KSC_023020 [Ktedonobacter sp. SOSP1-52]
MTLSHTPDPEEKTPLLQRSTVPTDRFLAVMQGTADLFWILTPTGKMHDITSSWLSFTGQTEHDASGRGWLEAVYSADRPRMEALLAHVIHPGQSLESKCHICRQDRIYRLMSLRMFPVCTVAGTVCELVVSGMDITVEQMNEAQIHLAMETSAVGLWQYNLSTRHFMATEQWKRLYGLQPDAPVTFGAFLALVHPEDRARIENAITQTHTANFTCSQQFQVLRPDGSLRWMTSQLQYLADVPNQSGRLIGSAMDITELKETQERVTAILKSITDTFAHVDREWRFTYMNQRAQELIGLNEEALLAQRLWDIRPELLGTPFERNLRTAMETQQPIHFEYFFQQAQRWAAIHAYPALAGLSIAMQDITERKSAEADLRESEVCFRHFVDANLLGIIVHDQEGNILEANDNFLSLIGATREDVTTAGFHMKDVTPASTGREISKPEKNCSQPARICRMRRFITQKEAGRFPSWLGEPLCTRNIPPLH